MNFAEFLGMMILPLSFPLVNLAVSRKPFGVKRRKRLRIFYIILGFFMTLAVIGVSHDDGELFFCSTLCILTYFICYKLVVKRNFRIKIVDYDDLNMYASDLADYYGVKLTQGVIATFGEPPDLDDYPNAIEWAMDLNTYLEAVKKV